MNEVLVSLATSNYCFAVSSANKSNCEEVLQKSRSIHEEMTPVFNLRARLQVLYPHIPLSLLFIPNRRSDLVSELDIFSQPIFVCHILEVFQNFGSWGVTTASQLLFRASLCVGLTICSNLGSVPRCIGSCGKECRKHNQDIYILIRNASTQTILDPHLFSNHVPPTSGFFS